MRIKDKTEEIEGYLSELSEIMPKSLEEYSELKTKAACERYFEKIIEAAVDLSFLLIKERRLRPAEEDKESFDIISKEGLIPAELAGRLKDAKGMRNILAHEYGTVDDETVFHAITEELAGDIREFIAHVKHREKEEKG